MVLSLLTPSLIYGADQQEKITISLKNVSIVTFFKEIEKITTFKFFYKGSQVESFPNITVEAKDQTITSVLNSVFAKTNLTYIFNNKQIVIQQREGSQSVTVPLKISGKVSFEEDGSPVPYANIQVKGVKGAGSTTDVGGRYTISNIAGNAVLVITYIGYITQEIPVNGRAIIDIVIKEDVASLKEVVFTGYQTLPKERTTGSFSKIDTKELERTLSYNIQDKLENGTLSGLLSDPTTGISVRGVATISASRLPLVIVDGFPLQVDINQNTDASDAVDFDNLTRALNSINPNDVESVTLLKDAAATSIYGARAANGVIVINLKKTSGKVSDPEVNFSMNIAFKPKTDVNKLPYCNPETYFSIEQNRYNAGWFTSNATSSTEYTNLPDYFYVRGRVRDGILSQGDLVALEQQMKTYDNRNEFSDYFLQNNVHQQYNISVNQRLGFSNYRFSVAYDTDLAINKGNNDDRIVVNFSNQAKPLKWLVFTTAVNLTLRNEEKNGLSINDLFSIPQHQRILDENGNYTSMSKYTGISTGRQIRDDVVKQYSYFPYDWKWNIKQEWDNMDNTINTVGTRLQGGVQIKPIGNDLTIEAKYQYEFGSSKQKNYYNEQTFLVRNLVNTFAQPALLPVPKGGILEHQYGTNFSHNIQGTAIYTKKFAKKHDIVVLAGTEIREQSADKSNVRRYGYDPQTLSYVAQMDYLTKYPRNLMSTQSPYFIDPSAQWTTIYNYYLNTDRFVSLFGNMAYNYNDKYDFTASWRLDQSNMFGDSPKYRQVPLWSIGVGWTIDKESFFKVPFIDRLRLRATYGSSGNVDKSTSPYAIASIGGSYTNSTLALPGAKYNNPANPELRWEKTKQVNIGLEFAMLDNKLSGTIDYYYKKSTDLLATKNINSTYGFSSAKFNVGAIDNKGVDVTLSYIPIRKGSFSWRTQLMYSYNQNIITQTDKDIILNNTSISTALMYQQYRVVKGRPRFNLVSMPWGGLDATGYPQFIFKDSLYNWRTPQVPTWNNYKFADLKYEGTTLAPHYGSWNNQITYKGFELSFLLSYKFGHVYQHVAPFRVSNNDLFGIAQGNYIPHYAKEFENMWKEPGDELKTDIPKMPYELTGAQVRALTIWYTYPVNYGSHQTQSAANIRVQRISLSYSLDKKQLPKMISRLTFMLQGRNLGVITFNKFHEDPEFLPDMQGNFLLRTSPELAFSIMATF
ncbi:MAG: hypothetical protein A2X18_05150 [Bacteroidetes bacterium GWF2_40_14]|nr:MAG: hypothetical protein A2X18_05150 [Bacteroidetes bacterium GWF2_40_14]